MAAPFGFSVGDFIAVGQLIQQVTVELRTNGEAALEYQHLIIELESLDRALKQFQNLKPARHELLQLNAIRATALLCQIPLREFMVKISKFDERLGTWNATDQRFRGFHRRMQWRLKYRDDVKELRTKLGSHVATITLLLMTQTLSSVIGAENERANTICEFRESILAHRKMLEDVKVGVDMSIAKHAETKVLLETHTKAVQVLDQKADQAIRQLCDEKALVQEVKSTVSITEERTKSILAIATDALSQAALGFLTLRDIAKQLYNLTTFITKFTHEIRETVAKLMAQFTCLYKILQTLEQSLAKRICLPIVQFTDALGHSMALPYQVCSQWKTFRLMLDVVFSEKPGRSRVDMGNFLIMHAAGGRPLSQSSWDHAIKEGDHLQMSMVLNELLGMEDTCPFPSCQASLGNCGLKNGGRVCTKCGRWAVMRKIEDTPVTEKSVRSFRREEREEDGVCEVDKGEEEDIELYRYIHASIDTPLSDTPGDEKQGPIKFKDALGRLFSFPYELCKTWAGIEALIIAAFKHVDKYDMWAHVAEGCYDLVGSNGEIILPRLWEEVVRPDWSVSMHLWPIVGASASDPIFESPPAIRAPPIHQEIITHHTDIGVCFEHPRVPTPSPPPRRSEPRLRSKPRAKEPDIDIYTSQNNNEVKITQTKTRSPTPAPTLGETTHVSVEEPEPSPTQDRWAQIRKNAADRAAQRDLKEHTRDIESYENSVGDQDTIEVRVARIKRRVAELTGNA